VKESLLNQDLPAHAFRQAGGRQGSMSVNDSLEKPGCMLALRSFSEEGRVNPPHNFKKEVMWGMKEVREENNKSLLFSPLLHVVVLSRAVAERV
ncbi:MAG TPA: hypothetical protein VMV71_00340, partial [Candidatus Paceibacterota bacterium]|nr:hypothetical protein [Candidatus Paceibacterota bacterium]